MLHRGTAASKEEKLVVYLLRRHPPCCFFEHGVDENEGRHVLEDCVDQGSEPRLLPWGARLSLESKITEKSWVNNT